MERSAQERQTRKFSRLAVAQGAEISASLAVPRAPITNARRIASHAG
ncbi:hypothetical protein [Bradyrhizobium sp.]|jgi:hypothetical protein